MAGRFARVLGSLFLKRKPAVPGVSALSGRKTALVTGTVAVGALVTGAVVERSRRIRMPLPQSLPPALDVPVRELQIKEGRARYYFRDGSGTPLVLLHSVNAAGSSYEMKPLFDYFAAQTTRPIYAVDWFGFGLSDRPPVHYAPGLFQRQLRHLLSEHVRQPADVVALSLACEFAAAVANAFPDLVRRMVLIAPTALSDRQSGNLLQRTLVGAADNVGAFDAFFARLTRRDSIRRFYERQVFIDPKRIPDDLVSYAYVTTHARGAHHAPRHFVEGSLFMNERARRLYALLRMPTLLLTPERADFTIQSFERLPEVLAANPQYLHHQVFHSGLLPHWESPEEVTGQIGAFLAEEKKKAR